MCGNYYLIKGNPERLKKESDRVSLYLNDKYKNDEEFRKRKKQYAKEYQKRKTLEKKLADQARTERMPDIILG